MKKLIVSIIIIGMLVGGYFWLKKHGKIGLGVLEGERVKVHRGDLDVPITASGRVEPASVTKLKGKASGEVKRLPQKIGDMVALNEVVVELDTTDEQRTVDQMKAGFEAKSVALDLANIELREAKEVGVPAADADLLKAKAQFLFAQNEFIIKSAKASAPESHSAVTDQEFQSVKAQRDQAEAGVKAAAAQLSRAHINVEKAAKNILTMEQNKNVAQRQLDEANQRLDETTILSPINGMVLRQYVTVGEVVQSGKTSLTGGTVLLDLADVSNIYAVVNVDEADIGLVRELAPEDARPGASSAPSSNHGTATKPAQNADAASGEKALSRPAELPSDVIDPKQRVEVTVESFPNEKFYGVIERIAPQSELSQAIATFKVWIRITSPNKSMLVGLLNLQAEAHFTAKSVRDALLVSYEAFQKNPEGDGFGVYVPVVHPKPGQKKYEFKRCEFGRDNGIDVEVVKGLTEGEEVYTKLPMETRKEEKAAEKAED